MTDLADNMADVLTDEPPFDIDKMLDAPNESDDAAWSPWTIGSLGEAEWAMSKLAAARMEIDTAEAQAKEWHQRIDNAKAKNTARARRTAEFMGDRLGRFMLEVRRDTDRKSLALPSGQLKTRENPSKVVIDDEAAYLGWVQREGLTDELLNPPKPSITALARAALIVEMDDGTFRAAYAGEQIPGVTVQPGAVSCTVNPADDREPF